MGVPFSSCGKCPMCFSKKPQLCKDVMTNATGLSSTYPGAYAQQTKVPVKHILKLTPRISDIEGSLVKPTAVIYHAFEFLNIKETDKVLIIGGSIIGHLATMFTKKRKANFVAMSETNSLRGKKY